MEWLSAENVVAVLTAVLNVLTSIGVLWYERRVPRRERIGYRVQMDTPIGSDAGQGRASVRIGYSELRSGTKPAGAHRIAIDGDTPSVDTIGTSSYPYREIECAYTYGSPPADSPASYLSRGSGQAVIRTHGHLPCAARGGRGSAGKE